MEQYKTNPQYKRLVGEKSIGVFPSKDGNIDRETIQSFGDEWLEFDEFSDEDIRVAGDEYFDIVPESVYAGKYVLDVGCGTGRWSKYLSGKVSALEAVDPSEAVLSAAALLQNNDNVRISQASAGDIPFSNNTFDFVLSLGVLHHIPDTQAAMQKCVDKLKPGGHFLAKTFQGGTERELLTLLKRHFVSVHHVKPPASREGSARRRLSRDFLRRCGEVFQGVAGRKKRRANLPDARHPWKAEGDKRNSYRNGGFHGRLRQPTAVEHQSRPELSPGRLPESKAAECGRPDCERDCPLRVVRKHG